MGNTSCSTKVSQVHLFQGSFLSSAFCFHILGRESRTSPSASVSNLTESSSTAGWERTEAASTPALVGCTEKTASFKETFSKISLLTLLLSLYKLHLAKVCKNLGTSLSTFLHFLCKFCPQVASGSQPCWHFSPHLSLPILYSLCWLNLFCNTHNVFAFPLHEPPQDRQIPSTHTSCFLIVMFAKLGHNQSALHAYHIKSSHIHVCPCTLWDSNMFLCGATVQSFSYSLESLKTDKIESLK